MLAVIRIGVIIKSTAPDTKRTTAQLTVEGFRSHTTSHQLVSAAATNTTHNKHQRANLRVRHYCCRAKAINITFVCVCVCVCLVRAHACVCPGAWACACCCLHVALLIQHATRMVHIVTSVVASLAPSYFSTLYHKRHDLKKKLLNTKYVF